MNIEVIDSQGKKVGEKKLPAAFSIDKINEHLIWEVVKAEHAAKRQGTHKTKEKGEVSGGGAKPWRQKGTGRARSGSNRSPVWRGGGTIFGPQPRCYTEGIGAKKKRVGINHIVAKKAGEKKIVILENWKSEGISTKKAFEIFEKVVKGSSFAKEYEANKKIRANSNDKRKKIAVLVDLDAPEYKKSVKNIPWIEMLHIERLAALPLFYSHGIVITQEAFGKLNKK
ncbi:MAG: 50S ribosomal protein L4 [Spirochaetia bacterium]|nr:50S ribosomal protein L4 [Spirochaetia bacterium]